LLSVVEWAKSGAFSPTIGDLAASGTTASNHCVTFPLAGGAETVGCGGSAAFRAGTCAATIEGSTLHREANNTALSAPLMMDR